MATLSDEYDSILRGLIYSKIYILTSAKYFQGQKRPKSCNYKLQTA